MNNLNKNVANNLHNFICATVEDAVKSIKATYNVNWHWTMRKDNVTYMDGKEFEVYFGNENKTIYKLNEKQLDRLMSTPHIQQLKLFNINCRRPNIKANEFGLIFSMDIG